MDILPYSCLLKGKKGGIASKESHASRCVACLSLHAKSLLLSAYMRKWADFCLLKGCLASLLALWGWRLPNITIMFQNLFSFFNCPYLEKSHLPVLNDLKYQILDSFPPTYFFFLRFYLSFCVRIGTRDSVAVIIWFHVLRIGQNPLEI